MANRPRSTAAAVLVAAGLLGASYAAYRLFAADRVWLTDVTRQAGITFTHTSGVTGKYSYLEIMGGGVALFDHDGDGWLDIYFVNGNHILSAPSPEITNVLYRNNRDGTFTDVTQAAGVGDSSYGQGCCAADYDNDGDQDLYVTNFGPDRLYRNEGGGRFVDVTAAAGIDNPRFGQSCAFADFDADGRLDIYVQNYITYSVDEARSANRSEYPTPLDFPGSADLLYHNNGDGTFTDVTQAAGINRPGGRGMGLACVDFDGDRDIDIFVANDAMENYYFTNNGDLTFTEQSIGSGLAYNREGVSESSMGVDVGDVNGDGTFDIVCPALRAEGCKLYSNRGTFFEDVSRATRLIAATRAFTGFSPNLLDVDNDGDLDLFLCNGGVATNLGVGTGAPYVERYGVRDLLLLNDGTGSFDPVGSVAGAHFDRALIGRGSATGDLDNDGDLDLVICNLDGPAVVLRNDAPRRRWITLDLVPGKGNQVAIGAKVRLTAAGRTQSAVVPAGGSYLSLSDRRLHFGLGDAERIDRIDIDWPDGSSQSLADVATDRFLTIQQKEP